MDEPRPVAPLCFLDTETDGVHPGRKAWEIAIVRREPDGSETEWQTFVEIDLSTADPFGLRVGRFYDRHPTGRWLSTGATHVQADIEPKYSTKLTAAHKVARLTYGAHIVGAVPDFDTYVLDRLLRDNGLVPAWHYHLVDVENLAVGFLAAKGVFLAPPYHSDEILDALGLPAVPEEARHTAMGDVRWMNMAIYDAVMGKG